MCAERAKGDRRRGNFVEQDSEKVQGSRMAERRRSESIKIESNNDGPSSGASHEISMITHFRGPLIKLNRAWKDESARKRGRDSLRLKRGDTMP